MVGGGYEQEEWGPGPGCGERVEGGGVAKVGRRWGWGQGAGAGVRVGRSRRAGVRAGAGRGGGVTGVGRSRRGWRRG